MPRLTRASNSSSREPSDKSSGGKKFFRQPISRIRGATIRAPAHVARMLAKPILPCKYFVKNFTIS
jgi:hypothetical protein